MLLRRHLYTTICSLALPLLTTAQAIPLGAAATFGVLGASTVTNTGVTTILGDVGVSSGSSVTGFPPGVVNNGTIHVADATAVQANTDATNAYTLAAGLPSTADLSGVDLGGLTLPPGVYRYATSAILTGPLVLDGQGDPNALFVFQIGSSLTVANGASVNLINGAQACNVIWQVGSSASLGLSSTFNGIILAQVSITATTAANVGGSLIALTGAVTLDTNVVTVVNSCGPTTTTTTVVTTTLSTTVIDTTTGVVTVTDTDTVIVTETGSSTVIDTETSFQSVTSTASVSITLTDTATVTIPTTGVVTDTETVTTVTETDTATGSQPSTVTNSITLTITTTIPTTTISGSTSITGSETTPGTSTSVTTTGSNSESIITSTSILSTTITSGSTTISSTSTITTLTSTIQSSTTQSSTTQSSTTQSSSTQSSSSTSTSNSVSTTSSTIFYSTFTNTTSRTTSTRYTTLTSTTCQSYMTTYYEETCTCYRTEARSTTRTYTTVLPCTSAEVSAVPATKAACSTCTVQSTARTAIQSTSKPTSVIVSAGAGIRWSGLLLFGFLGLILFLL